MSGKHRPGMIEGCGFVITGLINLYTYKARWNKILGDINLFDKAISYQ